MKFKELVRNIGVEAAKIHDRMVLTLEPPFVHKPNCARDVILKRSVENKPSFRIVYRQCESCGAQDQFKENYVLNDFRIGW